MRQNTQPTLKRSNGVKAHIHVSTNYGDYSIFNSNTKNNKALSHYSPSPCINFNGIRKYFFDTPIQIISNKKMVNEQQNWFSSLDYKNYPMHQSKKHYDHIELD